MHKTFLFRILVQRHVIILSIVSSAGPILPCVCVCARVVALLQPRVSRAVWDGGERGVHFRYKKGRESGRKEGGEEGSHLVHLSA